MSKTTQTERKQTPALKRVERGPTMSGSEILVACLEREGVDTIFAYPGGASMEIHQALTRSKKIRTVLPRHEQGGAFAAEGYALLKAFRKRNKKEAVVIPQTGGTGYRLFYHDDSWQAWEEAADWIGTHARSDAIVATTAPHLFYLRTGRLAVLPPMEPDPVHAGRLLEGVPVSYVIVDDLKFLDLSRRYARPAVKNDPMGWQLVHSIHLRNRPLWIKPADFPHDTEIYQRVTAPR